MCIAVIRLQLNLIKAADPIYLSTTGGRPGRGDTSIPPLSSQRKHQSVVSANFRQSVSLNPNQSISFAPTSPKSPSSSLPDSFLPHIPGATRSFNKLSKKRSHRATVASLRDLTSKHGAAEEGRQGAVSPFGGIRIDQTMTLKEDKWSRRPRSGRGKGSKGSWGETLEGGWEVVSMQDIPRKQNSSNDLLGVSSHMAETRPNSATTGIP
jgi:hypothetical protein